MSDRIFVANLCVHGFHGVAKAEKSLGQRFYVDIECWLQRAIRADAMEETVCYGKLCDVAEQVSATTSFNLIESLADRIAAELLARFPLVQKVRIQVRKPSAPIRHSVDFVGIEIERRRDD